jgi:hypothetical protein
MRIFSNYSIVIIGLVLLILTGCSKEALVDDEKKAEAYVKTQGYKITSHKGQIATYILDKSKLESTQYQQAWGVQKIEPEKYFGKEITLYEFTVSNHPLEKIYYTNSIISIMLCEGKVIGGTSFPDDNGKQKLVGAPYSLDGKTLEEVTGMTYKEWTENWKKKYGN